MSTKSRIALKPRFRCQSTNNSDTRIPGSYKTPGASCQYDVASTEFGPMYYRSEKEARYHQATHWINENLCNVIDGKALPYLPSSETSNAPALSSKIYRLKPRPTSNQILFLR